MKTIPITHCELLQEQKGIDSDPRETQENADRYFFTDGTTEELEVAGSCGMLGSMGDGSGYTAINTAKGSSYSIFKLTGTKDEISEQEIRGIDFTNEREAYDSVTAYEPYAEGERSSNTKIISQTCFYNIKGSSNKLYVHFSGDKDGRPYISYAMVIDITKLLTEQKPEVIYDRKT